MNKITFKEAEMEASLKKKELLNLIKTQYPTVDIDTVEAQTKVIEQLITDAVCKAVTAMKDDNVNAFIEALVLADAAEAVAIKAAEAVITKAAATEAAEAAATRAASAEATATI